MENPLKTKLGIDIPLETRGILYLCNYTGGKITVVKELLFEDPFSALEAYANIPNPESQVVYSETFDELIVKLQLLHKNMEDIQWLKELGNCI